MIKTLYSQVKEYKKTSILAAFFTVMEVIMELLIPLTAAAIIDRGIETGELKNVFLYGSIMILMAILSLFFGIMAGRTAATASTGYAKNLRETTFSKIQTFSFSNIDKFSTAGLITRLTTDVTNMQNAYQMLLRMCLRAPISLIGALTMSFLINPKIASIFLIAIAFLAIAIGLILKFVMKYFSQVFQKYDDLNASVQENVSAIRVVKAFVREKFEKSKFHKAADNLYNMFVKVEKIAVLNSPVMMITIYASMISLAWFSANLIVIGDMTTGNLTSFFSYCMTILSSFMMISMVFVMLTMAMASAKRIIEVLDEKVDIVNADDPIFNVKSGDITFENVSFSYYKSSPKPVLDKINLTINEGQTIGILGSTGSGKTSFINLISRLYEASEGAVLVGGVNVRDYDIETLRNSVSVVLQKNELFSGTILDNLRWGDENATEEQCIHACKLACADDFIERMPEKYNTFIEQGGNNVSGGQKQRLCIARALLKKPKILILDDSTSAVDTSTDAKIRKSFKEDIPAVTKIIISQRISSIKDADKIIVFDDGKIDAIETHDN